MRQPTDRTPPWRMTLPEPEWHERRRVHHDRVDRLLAGHLERRRRGEKHPVEDFLFTYYSFRPSKLRRWHPGYAVALSGPSAREFLRSPGYVESPDGVTLDRAEAVRRIDAVRWIRGLLAATAARPRHFGCFGLHEWAMVYRSDAEEIRHSGWPLRLGGEGTDEVVERHRIRCSHFDAFRFFTEQARPRNTLQPRREDQPALEQGGCLHANMDCYKWAAKLSPLVDSDLVADCFELARDIRELDMRASPYDLSGLGYEPVRIETREGKAAYVEAQSEYAERAGVLRTRLVDACDTVLADPLLADPLLADPLLADTDEERAQTDGEDAERTDASPRTNP